MHCPSLLRTHFKLSKASLHHTYLNIKTFNLPQLQRRFLLVILYSQ